MKLKPLMEAAPQPVEGLVNSGHCEGTVKTNGYYCSREGDKL